MCMRRRRHHRHHGTMGMGRQQNSVGGGMGQHNRRGGMGGRGAGMGPSHREAIQNLMQNREQIDRVVNETSKGVVTTTTSNDPKVAEWIVRHVNEMKGRMDSGQPVRRWDPLFAAIFENHEKITLNVKELVKENGDMEGIQVEECGGGDSFSVALIQAHAKAVTGFLDPIYGPQNMHAPHPVPAYENDKEGMSTETTD